ncbi:MAG TPA: patatin-like phospholipase family protein [Polyangiaceae bacterium]|nr:patatin-like phospholipase family protein [Polyangiaceae bacterium]
MRPARPAAALLAAALAAAPAARGDEPAKPAAPAAPPAPAAPAPPGPRPLSLTISGGVSLGSYEAGFLYYALEVAKRTPQAFELRLATGASAGSINALLSLLSACSGPDPAPSQSLFYSTWVPIGFRELFVPEDATALGVFSRRHLGRRVERLEARWRQGLAEACDAVLGVSVTRLEPKGGGQAHNPLSPARVEERFALRLRGRGPGREPELTNYVDPAYQFGQPMLPEGPGRQVAFASLRDLLYASSAFPIAFPPVRLAHCVSDPLAAGAEGPRCPPPKAERDLFLDGGVFDNQPLRFATRLAGAGLRDAAGPGGAASAWAPSPGLDAFRLPERSLFVHFSPDTTDYPLPEVTGQGRKYDSALDLVERFFEHFIVTARSKELSVLFEERPELRARVLPARRHYPTVSGLLAAFFGFFERDFRVFDFYLGMYDARRFYTDEVRALDGAAPPFSFPEDGGGPAAEWRPLACMRAVLDGEGDPARACAGAELANFRALLQTSLDRLYDDCAGLPVARSGEARNRHCRQAIGGGAPPRVPGAPGPGWPRRDVKAEESEFSYTLRLLVHHRFHFRDLGVGRDEGALALRRVRAELGRVVDRLAAVQPRGAGAAVSVLGTPALNLLSYSAPETLLYGVVGIPFEVGVSASFPGSRWFPSFLRLDAGLQVRGLATLLSSEKNFVAPAPFLGVEADLPFLSGSLVQARLGARAAYVLSTGDAFHLRACPPPDDKPRVGDCSRFGAQAVGVFTLYDRLRLHLLAEWYPALRRRDTTLWSVGPALGLQLAWPF